MDAPRPIHIRTEHPGDAASIRRVIESAFKSRTEADIVDQLRAHNRVAISLVAPVRGAIVGHVLLIDVKIEGAPRRPRGAGVAPLTVRPTFQRRGVGAALMHAALDHVRDAGYGFVVLLGDPAYYRRFGFRTASSLGLECEFEAPDEAFMAIEVTPGALAGVSGVVRYPPEFAATVT
jgi:putative acetyltransferase